MTKIKTTEPEFKAQIEAWINEILKELEYPFECASSEASIKISQTRGQPDLVIWINRQKGNAFVNWEIKTPEIPADDSKLLKDAMKKSKVLNTKYFITFNLRELWVWENPKPGEDISSQNLLKTYRPKCNISLLDDFWNKANQARIKEMLRELIIDLIKLHKDDTLYQYQPDIFFVNKLSECAREIAGELKNSLIKSLKNRSFERRLRAWASKQGIPNFGDERSYDMLSRQITYRLLGKILFYLTLRRFRPELPNLDIEKVENFSQKLQEYFARALRIDYQAIFERDLPDEIPLPRETQSHLVKLIGDLNRYDFSSLPQEIIGSVFEKLIPPEERHDLGQYFTNEELVDLILAFCLRGAEDKLLDPTCGSGTFLIRAYDWFKTKGVYNHKKLLSRLWGIDIASFPAELATINLYRQDLSDYQNFPRIIVKDFFEAKPEQEFEFPPPKPTADPDYKIKENMPLFDCAVGNFPYIRQELIERTNKGYKAKLEQILAEDWRTDYPDLFKKGNKIKLSGQADIYAYLFFHTAKFLSPDGRMGFVTSNAWLDVAYGYELQKFFLKKFKLIAILESRCEPWFEYASVNTVVTILERCDDKEAREENFVKFVKIKNKLKELIPWDLALEPDKRWRGIIELVRKIEYAEDKAKPLIGKILSYEDEDFRIRIIQQKDLLEELEQEAKTVKWGKYLRAPDVYFEILEKCKDKLVPLKEIADIRRGFTTGINEFFYLDEEKIKRWGIEEEFLKPVIKSPKESDKILIDPSKLKFKIFMCNKSKNELKKEKKFGALKYIEWGEKQKTKQGVPWPKVPTVSGRKYWYGIEERKPGKLLLQMINFDRFLSLSNQASVQVDHNLFELITKNNNTAHNLALYLNSTIASLFRELKSRINLGEGATKTEGIDWMELECPKIDYLKKLKDKKNIFDKLAKRTIKDIFNEIKQRDRQELDSLVLKALGLNPDEYLDRIYQGLSELVRERIELAKSRKKVKGVKVKRDINKLKEQVIEEFSAQLSYKFPEGFLDKEELKKPKVKEITISNQPLKLARPFMNLYPVEADDGFCYEAKSLDEAKFIIYSQKPDSVIVKVPKSQIVIIKAVQDYEHCYNELSQEISNEIYERTTDHKLSENLTRQILEEFGWKKI